MTSIRPVILCGGSGSRLWPLSRTGFPKQFLCLTGNESLFQQAAKRLVSLNKAHAPYIISNEEHRFLALEQLREKKIEPGSIFLEPSGRNTAPALTLAALAALDEGEDPILVVTSADQTIEDPGAFTQAIELAIKKAAQGVIVILGVTPDRPETGYGYVKINASKEATREVARFIEKPDAINAQQYLADGNYFWNAGIFVLKASIWLQALNNFRPDIAKATRKAWDMRSIDASFIRPGKTEFYEIPSESIDYAVMESCPGSIFPIEMVPLEAGWSDLGTWDAVWNALQKDNAGNVHHGDVLSIDSQDSLVHASSRLVSLVGVKNLVIIETADAVLVAEKSHAQDVKHIVSTLNRQKREEHTLHRKVHRPWGWYDSIDDGICFKVKRIGVKEGASLSLQKHSHRAEHWVIVRGTAEVTRGTETFLLHENQSTFIPLGEVHRLRNPGPSELELIEIQTGKYLDEDDIVRFEDHYGRV